MKDLAVITALNHSGYFENNFVEFKNILKMLFTSQGRSVKGKTLPSFKTSGKVFFPNTDLPAGEQHVCFNELCRILTSPYDESKYKQQFKILSDTTQQNV